MTPMNDSSPVSPRYEKPTMRELPLKGAFAIGTYSMLPSDPHKTVEPRQVIVPRKK